MIKAKENLTDKVYGRLTVIEQAEDYILPNGRRRSRWLCKCECGNETIVEGSKLKNGHTRSCHHCNKYDYIGNTIIVTIRDGSSFMIDANDEGIIKPYCWYKNSSGYIVRREGNSIKLLHRELLNVPKNMVVDHINGDKTDNRRQNLRACSYSQNAMNIHNPRANASGYTGVIWDKAAQRWKAQICVNKVRKHLGAFTDKEKAVKARKEAEKLFFGEYAH